MAMQVDTAEDGPTCSERRGSCTWEFINWLCGRRHTHELSYDLESSFWVILYHSLLYVPRDKADELETIIPRIFEQRTCVSVPSGGDGKIATLAPRYMVFGDSLEFTHSKPLTFLVSSMLYALDVWMYQAAVCRGAQQSPVLFQQLQAAPYAPLILPERTHKNTGSILESTLDLTWPTDDKADFKRKLPRVLLDHHHPSRNGSHRH
ncbi:hypothetical protein PLEOSDRAFT_153756 [Pleurotus ostreatus PC15]|uniref:Fungal-type protein kinase domain-containing protein n=1 Tax=Pleurotus ostreatus (strain PC15) TaxID=1137138 RepID=A0A067NZZ3_PLEO1|nr:hypothetical protein PLEOSDRAFT_153756 [Pleurotus ostreatus PC15]